MTRRAVPQRRGSPSIGTLVFAVLGGCAGPPPSLVDTEVARATRAGYEAFVAGSLDRAVRLYMLALNRARMLDDALEVGNAAYNLAACHVEAGDTTAARLRLVEAEDALRRAGADLADVLLLRARTARLAGDPARAAEHARRVLTDPGSRPTTAHRAAVHVLRGHLAIDRGDTAAAGRERDAAIGQLGGEPVEVAAVKDPGTCGLAARLARTRDPVAAARLFDRQADLWRAAGSYRPMALALAEAGTCWRAAGHDAEAADRLYRAACCHHGLGDATRRDDLLGKATQAARRAGATELLLRIEGLRLEVADPDRQLDQPTPAVHRGGNGAG